MTSKWPFLPLSDVCDIKNGGTPDTKNGLFWDGDHAWVTPAEMGKLQSPYLGKTRRKLTDTGLASCTAQLLPPQSVILSSRAPIGHLVINEVPMATNQGCKGLIPSPALDYKYLYYFLAASRELLNELGSGTTFAELSMTKLKEVQIPLPPLDEQKRIVAKLDEAMELVNEKLKNIQCQHKWSPDFLASKQAELMNPKNEWHEFTLGEVAEIFDGPHATPPKTSEGPWYLSISSLSNGAFDLEKSAHLSELDFPRWTKRTAVFKGDTLFSYETRIGQAGFWDLDEPAALGRRMGILRPLKNLVPRFLTEVYLSPQYQDEIKSHTSEGATVDRIPIANMDQWPIRIPNLETQMAILRELGELRELCSSLGDAHSCTEMALADLKSSTLAAAFAGEL